MVQKKMKRKFNDNIKQNVFIVQSSKDKKTESFLNKKTSNHNNKKSKICHPGVKNEPLETVDSKLDERISNRNQTQVTNRREKNKFHLGNELPCLPLKDNFDWNVKPEYLCENAATSVESEEVGLYYNK